MTGMSTQERSSRTRDFPTLFHEAKVRGKSSVQPVTDPVSAEQVVHRKHHTYINLAPSMGQKTGQMQMRCA